MICDVFTFARFESMVNGDLRLILWYEPGDHLIGGFEQDASWVVLDQPTWKPAQLIISHSTAKNTVISSITMPASRIQMPRRYWMTKVNKQFGSSSSTTSTPSNGSIGEDETKRKRASNEKASRQGYALSYCTKQLLPLGYLLTPGIKMYNM